MECNQVGELKGGRWDSIFESARRVYGGDGLCPTVHTMGGGNTEIKVLDEQNAMIREDGTVGALTTDGSSPKHNNRLFDGYRIRKLTPKECFRLMDFDDEDYEKVKAIGMSDSQMYKQCGNSIVVACLEGIFKNLFEEA